MTEYPESFSKLIFSLHTLTRKLIVSLDYENFLLQLVNFVLEKGNCDVVGAVLEEKEVQTYFSSKGTLVQEVEEEILSRISQVYFKLTERRVDFKNRQNLLKWKGKKIYAINSHFFVPIFGRKRGEVIGLIYFGSQKKDAFDSQDIQFYYALSEHASFALGLLHELLDEDSKRLKSIFSELPYGILLLEESGKIIVQNDLGKQLLLHFCRENGLKECINSLGAYSLGYIVQKEQGVEIEVNGKFFRVKAKSITYAAKKVYLLVIEDITKAKEQEKRILGQERLAAVGKLAAGIAHDFNNILNIILGYVELIKKDVNLSDKSKERLNTLISQSERAASLVKQILDFSRKSYLNNANLALGPFLKEQVKFYERTIPSNIEINLLLESKDLIVYGDLASLQQVFNNIVVNSKDAMPQGGRIDIVVSKEEIKQENKNFPLIPKGEWVKIEIIDTGKGIPKDVLPHIFEPFFTTKEVGQGTGLGLAQAYGVIKQHNGYIFARSKEGRGTVITIYLPLVKLEKKVEQAKKEALEIKGQKELVLVVEDDESLLSLLETLLEELNYRSILARDAEEAMSKFLRYQKEIGVIISDIVLPGQSGLDFLERVFLLKAELKALLISGYPCDLKNFPFKDRCLFLAKPFSFKKISLALHKLLLN